MKTYNDIYQLFIDNTKVQQDSLPTTIEDQIRWIHNGVREYNMQLRQDVDEKLSCNDLLEEISEELNDAEALFLTECMSYRVFQNMVSDFVGIWEVFQNDVGRKNYRDQRVGLEGLVKESKERLRMLKQKLYNDYPETDGVY